MKENIRPGLRSVGVSLAILGLLLCTQTGVRAEGCVGDCNGNNTVTVDELIMMVNIGLGTAEMAACSAGDANADSTVSVDEMVTGVNAALTGCPPPGPTPTPTPGIPCEEGKTPFNSTFEGIQKVIFEKRGCTELACHGSAAQGGLVLTPDVAYQSLVEASSTESVLARVEPGNKDRSYLWLKLAKSTNPSSLPPNAQVGAPMPSGLPPITQDELDAVRLWIYAGAPETGTVPDTEALLDACLPPAAPIIIKPLDPPAAGTGVQLEMPPWPLEGHSEHEICFASYYDFTDQVPEQFRDPTGTMFRFDSGDLRQDPQSHHLILNRYAGSVNDIHDPSLGQWSCTGGDKAGQPCEPTDKTSCGAGFCISEIKQSFACIGFGPSTGGQSFYAVGGSQTAQAHTEYAEGVFAQFPMKGILYWNSHAFNLTGQNTTMHGRINYNFASDQRFPVRGIFNTTKIFSANAAPYTTQTLCQDHVLAQGTRLFELSSHTHKHGKHFTVADPSGTQIYESFIYNDPIMHQYDPPLAFDSAAAAQRTLRFCSFYNNGLAADGSPDPETVTRRSRVPLSAQATFGLCSPTACAAGRIGAPCSGVSDDRSCDSTPGANDGFCDACRITGGESTENEMFILIGSTYIDPAGAAAGSAASAAPATAAFDAQGRSTYTEVALPASKGCSSSHAGHATQASADAHAAHAGH